MAQGTEHYKAPHVGTVSERNTFQPEVQYQTEQYRKCTDLQILLLSVKIFLPPETKSRHVNNLKNNCMCMLCMTMACEESVIMSVSKNK